MHEAGVSLGGGCLRGAAHIGALKEIINHNINITHIAGSSAGAVVGGLYACGLNPDKMEDVLESLSIRKHLDFGFNRRGWLKGDKIYNTLLQLTDGKHFSDLDIPFAAVSIDLNSGELISINEGEVARALRASIAIPGIFQPVKIGDRLLVDGYILNNNPADVVKEMGAKNVIAVRVFSSQMKKESLKGLISYLRRYMDITSTIHTDQLLKSYADLLMDIDLGNVGRFDTKLLPTIIYRGQQEARKALAKERAYMFDSHMLYLNHRQIYKDIV